MNSQQQQDIFFMRLAISEAQKALNNGEVPIGAIVVHSGTIIGRGYNMVETLCDATAHAEMQALTAASSTIGGKYLKDCTLYVTLEPCAMCAGACFWTQISRVVYGASDPKRGAFTEGKKLFHPKTEVISGILETDCHAVINNFFENLRK